MYNLLRQKKSQFIGWTAGLMLLIASPQAHAQLRDRMHLPDHDHKKYYLGIGLIFLSVGIGRSQKRADKVFLSLGHIGLALLQVFPILLWLSFHGSGLSDGTPPSIFVAHWLYSIPHLAVFLVSLMALYQLWWLPAPASAV